MRRPCGRPGRRSSLRAPRRRTRRPGRASAHRGRVTGIVSSRTSPQSGVSMLRKTCACDACLSTSSRVTSPAGPLGMTSARSTPRSRASLRIGGFATTPTDAATRSFAVGRREPVAGGARLGVAAGAVADEHRALSGRGRSLGGLAVLALADGRRARGRGDGRGDRDDRRRRRSPCRPPRRAARPTVPANGDGSSTSDFAVSISTSTSLTATVSPGATRQDTISASVRPSPTSGRTKGLGAHPVRPNEISRRGIGRRPRGCGRRRAGRRLRASPAGRACRSPTRAAPAPRGRRTRAP